MTLQELIDEYLATLDDMGEYDYLETDRGFAQHEIGNFMGWLQNKYPEFTISVKLELK